MHACVVRTSYTSTTHVLLLCFFVRLCGGGCPPISALSANMLGLALLRPAVITQWQRERLGSTHRHMPECCLLLCFCCGMLCLTACTPPQHILCPVLCSPSRHSTNNTLGLSVLTPSIPAAVVEHGGRDRHFCIGVADVDRLATLLDGASIPYTRSMSGRPAIFFRDPDSNTLECVELEPWR